MYEKWTTSENQSAEYVLETRASLILKESTFTNKQKREERDCKSTSMTDGSDGNDAIKLRIARSVLPGYPAGTSRLADSIDLHPSPSDREESPGRRG